MWACGKASACESLKLTVRQCSRHYSNHSNSNPHTANGKSAARSEDPLAHRDLLVNVLNASATKRDAKHYLSRFQIPRLKEYLGPNLREQEERNARCRRDQDRLERVGVNLGGLYSPAKAIADTPQFSVDDAREQLKLTPVAPIDQEELHVALACLKHPETIDDETLDGLARTISQLVKLDMRIVLVLDISANNIQTDQRGSSLTDVRMLRKISSEQENRLCDAIDRHNAEGARSVPNALEVVEDHWEQGIESSELRVTMSNHILDPLRRGMVPIVPSLAYTASGQMAPVDSSDIMAALTKHIIGKDEPDQAIDPERVPISLDRIVVLDAIGGIPSKDRGDGAHVFINLEQEYDMVESELAEYAEAARRRGDESRSPDLYDQHRDNLEMVRRCLHVLPPASSGLIVSPQEAASSSQAAQVKLPPLGAGTRRQKNPLIHNLLTNKPIVSSSLPTARLTALDDEHEHVTLTEASTVLRKGMSLIVIPAADRLLGWQKPTSGRCPLKLDKDPRVDLPRLVNLIEDSFRRKLDVRHYLQRVQGRLAGIVVAGKYEGGAILTWEMPPGVNDPKRLVPYLDKFAVLQSSQGSSGVADIVFQAMVRTCFPQGVCWRSRKDNPVNKWYFERAAGSWQIPNSNWTMFWTGEDVVDDEQKWNDYVSVCSSIQASWADTGKKDD
jgi:amino-acid N-acetyltransferase